MIRAGTSPDVAALWLPVPQWVLENLSDGQIDPWVLCNLRLGVFKGSQQASAANVFIEYAKQTACHGGLPVVAIPYGVEPPPLDIIREANPVVPSDQAFLNGVGALEDLLTAENLTINVARAVVFTNAETSQTTYMAPVGPPLTEVSAGEQQGEAAYAAQIANAGLPIAMIVVPNGVNDEKSGLKLAEGAYLVREFHEVMKDGADQYSVQFTASDGKSVAGIPVQTAFAPTFDTEILFGLPSAGIYKGSNVCQSCRRQFFLFGPWICTCYTC